MAGPTAVATAATPAAAVGPAGPAAATAGQTTTTAVRSYDTAPGMAGAAGHSIYDPPPPGAQVAPGQHHSHLPSTGLMQQPSIMTVGGLDYGPNPRTEYKVVQREQVANPAPLGLFAFGYTTALLQGANSAITDASATKLAAAFGMFYGGLAQFMAGMWEFKRQNTFGAVAFTTYGAFWMGFALLQILVAAQLFSVGHNADQMMLSLWGILTFIFMIATFELNFCLSLLFFTLAVLFWVLAAGVEALFWERFAGWWGLVVAGIAWYIAAADTINEQYKRTVMPLGRWSVGVPMSKGLKRFMAKVPVVGWAYVKACNREDKAAGYSKPKKSEEEAGYPSGPGEGMFRPYMLHTTYSTPPGVSFDGQAVRDEQVYAPQGSAVGPY